MNQMFDTILQTGISEILRSNRAEIFREIKREVQECAEAQLSGKETCERLLNFINNSLTSDSVRRY